jgi:hypothetical protein
MLTSNWKLSFIWIGYLLILLRTNNDLKNLEAILEPLRNKERFYGNITDEISLSN